MAMIKCRECGREISSEAITCPQCGCPVESVKSQSEGQLEIATDDLLNKGNKKKNNRTKVLAIIFVLVVLGSVFFLAQLKNLRYEKCAYSTVEALRGILKNPDSLSVYDVEFYVANMKEDSADRNTITNEKHPIVIMHYTAQNGYGGNTTGYVIATYHKDSKTYEIDGYTYTLNPSEISKYDTDADWQKITIFLIKSCRENNRKVGSIDIKNLNRKIKNF